MSGKKTKPLFTDLRKILISLIMQYSFEWKFIWRIILLLFCMWSEIFSYLWCYNKGDTRRWIFLLKKLIGVLCACATCCFSTWVSMEARRITWPRTLDQLGIITPKMSYTRFKVSSPLKDYLHLKAYLICTYPH